MQARAMLGAPWTRQLEPFVTKNLESDQEIYNTFAKLREAPVQRYLRAIEGGASARVSAPEKLDADAVTSVHQSFALRHASRAWCAAADHSRRMASFTDRTLERVITRQISNMA